MPAFYYRGGTPPESAPPVSNWVMATLVLLLNVLTAQAGSVSPACVPGDPCCRALIGNFCRVGCPPPVPAPLFRPAPDVTSLERPHPTGAAIIEIAIDESGRVISACVLRSLRPDADRAAQRAALRSTWTQKLLNGRPVGSVLAVSYEFPTPPRWTAPVVTPRSKLPLAKGAVVYVDPAKGCPAGRGGPVRVGSVITNPPLLDYVEPPAPAAGVTGAVIVELVLEKDGSVARVTPLREAPGLTELVVHAVKKWRYARMCLNGQPVPIIVTAVMRYGATDAR